MIVDALLGWLIMFLILRRIEAESPKKVKNNQL